MGINPLNPSPADPADPLFGWESLGETGNGDKTPNVGVADPLAGIESDRRIATRFAAGQVKAASQPLYLDIETVPDEERMHLFDLPPLPEIPPVTSSASCPDPTSLLSGTIDRIKTELGRLNPDDAYLELLAAEEAKREKPRSGIAEACKAQRAARRAVSEAEAAREKEMSLTPEFCRIVAIGFAFGPGEPQSIIVERDPASVEGFSEKSALIFLWDLINAASPIVGYNILSFDLPVIRARSILLGVEPSRLINDSPWGNRDVTDLMLSRFGRAGAKAMKLKSLCRLYGIPVPAGDVGGGDVARLWREGELETLARYVRSDVAVTRELHRKFSGYFCV